MEWTTIVGLILGFASMGGVLVLGKSGATLSTFIDPPALLMVFGGAAAVTLVGFPSRQLHNLFSILKKPFVSRLEEPSELINELVQLAELARRDGLLTLESKAREIRDPFVALGIQLVVDGTRPEVVAEVMNHEVESRAARHREAKKIVELVGRCGPAFGMIATLLGLILMLGNLESPETIGPSMAVALIGTLYGALLANLICIPMGEKLSYLSHEELLARQIAIRGVLAIQAGDNPRVVRQKLDMFLPPRLREQAYARAA
jgi:chemotaxis protein MotA